MKLKILMITLSLFVSILLLLRNWIKKVYLSIILKTLIKNDTSYEQKHFNKSLVKIFNFIFRRNKIRKYFQKPFKIVPLNKK